MAKDRKVLYLSSALLLAALLATLFLFAKGGRIIAAILLPIAALALSVLVKKRGIPSIFKRQVLLIMAACGVLSVVLCYLTGFSFGFARSSSVGWITLPEYILPIASIIISTEIIRGVLAVQNAKGSGVLCYFICVCSELLAFGDIAGIMNFNLFMDFLGITVFPAVVANLLYQYLAKRYGIYPNIAYRLIIGLYSYVFYYVSAMPGALYAFARLIIPLAIYFFIDSVFEKKIKYAKKKKSRLAPIALVLSLVLMLSVVMIISCRFRFGMLVIATDSMTGEINKGDAIIYESYGSQPIDVDQVIVFDSDGRRTVHRVIEIKRINSQNRYITKGDANEDPDSGYVTDADIIGVCKFKIPYLGYPSLWLRETLKFN